MAEASFSTPKWHQPRYYFLIYLGAVGALGTVLGGRRYRSPRHIILGRGWAGRLKPTDGIGHEWSEHDYSGDSVLAR